MPDLWPDDFQPVRITPPLALLREQADFLEVKTQGKLKGSIASAQSSGRFYHNFYVTAPALDSSSYRLLSIEYPVHLYPLKLVGEPMDQVFWCNTEEEFVLKLREILADDRTKTVLSSILAQSQLMKS